MNRFPVAVPGEAPLPPNLALFDFTPYQFTLDDRSMAMDDLHIQLLFRLVSHPEIRTAVEIGCWNGASTAALIEAVNRGLLDRLDLVEIAPTASLKRLLALCIYPEKVTIHTKPYWETHIGRTDLVFMDGDHRWPVFAETLRAMSWGVPVLAMHDSKSATFVRRCWGAHMVSGYLAIMPGRKSWEDAVNRAGMNTRRGFFVSAPEAWDLGFLEETLAAAMPA